MIGSKIVLYTHWQNLLTIFICTILQIVTKIVSSIKDVIRYGHSISLIILSLQVSPQLDVLWNCIVGVINSLHSCTQRSLISSNHIISSIIWINITHRYLIRSILNLCRHTLCQTHLISFRSCAEIRQCEVIEHRPVTIRVTVILLQAYSQLTIINSHICSLLIILRIQVEKIRSSLHVVRNITIFISCILPCRVQPATISP